VLTSLPLLGEAQPYSVYHDRAQLTPTAPAANALARIRQSGVLRVCFRQSDYPSAFFNSRDELVGFDVELAHRFARQLDARLEFVPVASIRDAQQMIDDGRCDIFVSLTPIAPETTLDFDMTVSVMDSAIGLIVEDHRRRQFQQWDAVGELGEVQIGVLDTVASRRFLRRLLPEAKAVLIEDTAKLDAILAADTLPFDALLMTAEEGAAWTVRYPRYNLVPPSPILMASLAFPVRRDEDELVAFFNAWLLNAKADGTVDALYRYWMLGEVQKTQPPRWSIARDVLGWIE
jgi:ABC-type amino acid transport substrate-binding protein